MATNMTNRYGMAWAWLSWYYFTIYRAIAIYRTLLRNCRKTTTTKIYLIKSITIHIYHIIQFTLCSIWMREHNSLCRERKAKTTQKNCATIWSRCSPFMYNLFFSSLHRVINQMYVIRQLNLKEKIKLIKHIDIHTVNQQQQQQQKRN